MWSPRCSSFLLIVRHAPHKGKHNLPHPTATNVHAKGLHFSLCNYLFMSFTSDIGPALKSFKELATGQTELGITLTLL